MNESTLGGLAPLLETKSGVAKQYDSSLVLQHSLAVSVLYA